MQPINQCFSTGKVIVDPKQLASIIESCFQNSYELGFKVGYHRGRQDQKEDKPYNDHPET